MLLGLLGNRQGDKPLYKHYQPLPLLGYIILILTNNDNYMKKTPFVTCLQCKSEMDLLAQFTTHGLCGKCTRKNHKKLTNK